jgi:glycosyltransferase involved in cell wall biosynthesis
MSLPAVTVIIPTYNRAHFLFDSVRSVLDQTFDDLELIVVDDGSTDDTDELLATIDDPRLRTLKLEHRGISAAVNAGIRIARGRYVARQDSDDIWLPDLLATLVSLLDSRPDVGFVYARCEETDAELNPLGKFRGRPPRFPDDSLLSLLYADCTCNITIVARRFCFDEAGPYDESLEIHEDWDMWLRVAKRHAMAFVDRPLALVRLHDGNITSSRSTVWARNVEGRLRVLDKVFASHLPPAARAFKPIAYRNASVEAGSTWLYIGHPGRALRTYARALRRGGNPFATLARILWYPTNNYVLVRFGWGRRLLDWIAALRRSIRHVGGGVVARTAPERIDVDHHGPTVADDIRDTPVVPVLIETVDEPIPELPRANPP